MTTSTQDRGPTTSGSTTAGAPIALPRKATRVPFVRLVALEARKMVDTLSGRWMLIAMAAITVLGTTAVLVLGPKPEVSFEALASVTMVPLFFLLPIVGIMAATAEWSQRSGLVTFTLEPRRGRIISAKIMASALVGLVVTSACLAVAALDNAIGAAWLDTGGAWNIGAWAMAGFVFAVLLLVLQGVALGFAFLNTPVAVVALLLVPNLMPMLLGLSESLSKVRPYVDFNNAVGLLMDDGALTATQWGHVAGSLTLWVALPLAIGVWRVMTREVSSS